MAHPRDFGLQDPTPAGPREYAAIHETLVDALRDCEDQTDTPAEWAYAVLDEFAAYASEMRMVIVAAGVAETA